MAAHAVTPEDRLRRLAELLQERDVVNAQIAALTGRSAAAGDVGEWIASTIFDIGLADSRTQAGYDGRFRSGPLAGRTVNVKTYGTAAGGLDMTRHPCDFYLVLSGSPAPSTVGHRRWHLARVYLFDAARLLAQLEERGVGIGIATSLRAGDLSRAEIYPGTGADALLTLTDTQRRWLELFA